MTAIGKMIKVLKKSWGYFFCSQYLLWFGVRGKVPSKHRKNWSEVGIPDFHKAAMQERLVSIRLLPLIKTKAYAYDYRS